MVCQKLPNGDRFRTPSDSACGIAAAHPILARVETSATLQWARIGDFVFDGSTGEVRPVHLGSSQPAVRLPPQPTKLLELLIRKNGELATREEIREALWPDTHVDFDQSLHFCVRQIRSAFGDSATEPTYVETLPRRGYRLMRPVELVAEEASAAAILERDSRPAETRRRAGYLLWGSLLAIAAVIVLGLLRVGRAPAGSHPIRLAIMPFELATEGERSDDLARLTEYLLVELVGGLAERVDVVGPRSTARYSTFPFPDVQRLAEDLAIDHVLNARFLERDGESLLIVELIRLEDGVHTWVELFTDTSSWQAIGEEVRDNVVAALRPPP